ncbi:MAG: hypothetical protein RR540_04645 [Oscillospiraceae bacterium]
MKKNIILAASAAALVAISSLTVAAKANFEPPQVTSISPAEEKHVPDTTTIIFSEAFVPVTAEGAALTSPLSENSENERQSVLPRNISKNFIGKTLSTRQSQVVNFDLSGGFGSADNDMVDFSIRNVSGGNYSISLVDTTKNQIIVNGESHNGGHSFTLGGTAGHSYQFSLINDSAENLTYDLAISSYIE